MAALAFSYQERAISPWVEMGAYEAMWDEETAWFKSIAEKFASSPGSLPSDFVKEPEIYNRYASQAVSILKNAGIDRFGVRVHGAGEYPAKLRDAEHPIELLYYQGRWDLVETRCIAVVGTRRPTDQGISAASRVATKLVDDGFTIVSGLADGIDTVAHGAAILRGGRTIAVVGTPLWLPYPEQNAPIQRYIAKEHLVISQVPICRYKRLHYQVKPRFFPERNITMSALTEATVIVEASDTSGTLTQARAALKQGRKLFILDSCFRDKALKWPLTYQKRGAIRVRNYREIRERLA